MWNVFRVLEMEVFTGTEGVTAESCPNLEGCAGAGGERPLMIVPPPHAYGAPG